VSEFKNLVLKEVERIGAVITSANKKLVAHNNEIHNDELSLNGLFILFAKLCLAKNYSKLFVTNVC
jgi:hypothetical protein